MLLQVITKYPEMLRVGRANQKASADGEGDEMFENSFFQIEESDPSNVDLQKNLWTLNSKNTFSFVGAILVSSFHEIAAITLIVPIGSSKFVLFAPYFLQFYIVSWRVWNSFCSFRSLFPFLF